MARSAAVFVLLLAGAAAAQTGKYKPVAGRPQGKDVAALIAFEPARLSASAKASKLSIEYLWKTIEEECGLKAKSVERVELYIEPVSVGEDPFHWAAALKFAGKNAADKNARALLKIDDGTKPRPFFGRTLYESPRLKFTDTEYWGAYLLDPSVAVFGPRRLLHEMASPRDKVTPVMAAAEYLDANHDVLIAVAPEPLVKWLDRPRGKKPTKDDDFTASLKIALAASKAVTASIDLTKDPFLRIEFHVARESDVDAAHDVVKGLMTVVKAMYPQVRKGLLAGATNPEGGKALLAAMDAAGTEHKVTKEKKAVVVTAPRPKEWSAK